MLFYLPESHHDLPVLRPSRVVDILLLFFISRGAQIDDWEALRRRAHVEQVHVALHDTLDGDRCEEYANKHANEHEYYENHHNDR